MSWMTLSVALADISCLLRLVAEQLLDLVAALLKAAQRQAQVRHGADDHVEGLVGSTCARASARASASAGAAEWYEHLRALKGAGGQSAPGQFLKQGCHALLHLHDQRLANAG